MLISSRTNYLQRERKRQELASSLFLFSPKYLQFKLMQTRVPRISASAYSNTAPLVWSFLYGSHHGKVEMILDNAPSRSAELLAQDRVDAALTPVIAYQMLEGVRLIPDVCVGAQERVRSVRLVTRGMPLEDVRSVSLDTSSKTSVCLSKIIFREFLGFEPLWRNAAPQLENMLAESDCALLIGDPALALTASDIYTSFDIVELWRKYTGLGFVFAMWMTRLDKSPVDFAAIRDEGLLHIDEIAANYINDIGLTNDDLKTYLRENISFSIDGSMQKGLELYFELAAKNKLIETNKSLNFL